MANIALDIKANTTKALGEFKKLSRELDNKFLVQGLKLDVVKNAFRQINREFEQSLGSQGIAASESTGQIQRNAAAQLALYSKLGTKAAVELTSATKKQLSELVAQGDLTKGVMQEALQLQGTLKFDGEDFGVKSKKLTKDIATLGQSFNDIFGNNQGLDALGKIATGSYGIEDLQNLDFGKGGAGANLIREALLQVSGGMFDSLTGADRTDALRRAVEMLNDESTELGNLRKQLEIEADQTKAFDFAIRDLTGIFSETGLFGILRKVGPQIKNFEGADVDRNVLQLSAKLISTLFDQKTGLFAVLLKTLGEAFGFDPKNAIEPILRGAELLISVFEGITDFIESSVFKNFLGIFKPFIDAIKGVEMPEKITAEDINKGVSKIFGGIRGLLSNLNTYISNVDTKVVGDIVGNFLGEIINTLPDLIAVVFTSIGKAIDFVIDLLNSDGIQGSQLGSVLASVANGIGNLIVKTFQLIGAALPKIVGGALSGVGQLDGGGKLLLGGAIAEGLTRLFTGKGILGNLGETLSKGRSNLASRLNPFSKGQPRGTRGDNIAARGNEQQRWGRLYQYLDRILDVLGGEGLDGRGFDRDGGDRRKRRSRNEQRQRDRRARQLRNQRQARDIRSGTRRTRFSRVNNRFRRFGGGSVNLLRRGFDTLSPGRLRGYTNPIGPLPLNSKAPYAAAPGGGFTPRLESALRPSRFSQAGGAVRNFGGGVSQGVNQRLRGGFGMDKGNALNRGLIGTKSPDVASRFASRYGTRGILSRGAGRLGGGLLQGALTVGVLASIFGGGSAQAAEIDKDDSLSAEEKEFYKAENQKRTREEAGKAVIGAAGGILGGAAGSVFGPAGTIIGGMLGSVAGELVANVLPAPITEGVGKLAEDIGSWFGKAWEGIKGGWVSATASIGNFFGKEGPIQRFGRFAGDNVKGGVENIQKFFGKEGPIQKAGRWFSELGGKIKDGIENSWNTALDNLSNLAPGVLTFALGPLFGPILGKMLDEGEKNKKGTNRFAGGFSYLGGKNAFNEYEGFQMPDGVTFVPLSSLDTSMSSSGGSTTNNLEVTVNVTGGDPQAIATEVIAEIDKLYNSVNV